METGQAETSLWGGSGLAGGGDGEEWLVLDIGCGDPEEGSRAVECVWDLNQPDPDCSFVQHSSGAPEAPTGTVAKPHPWLNQVSPVRAGT